MNNIQFRRPRTDAEREEYARQYTPLVHKIVNQNLSKSPLPYDDLLGYGFIGLTDAMNTYQEGGSQSFLQYAAYRIYYAIMNGTYETGHIVRFSAYQQEKARNEGLPTFISKRIQCFTDDNGEEHWNIPELTTEQSVATVPDALDHLQHFVEARFSARDVDVFFSTFGIGGHEEIAGVQLAKKYHVTSASITYINQRIIKAIKADDEMREELEELLNA